MYTERNGCAAERIFWNGTDYAERNGFICGTERFGTERMQGLERNGTVLFGTERLWKGCMV